MLGRCSCPPFLGSFALTSPYSLKICRHPTARFITQSNSTSTPLTDNSQGTTATSSKAHQPKELPPTPPLRSYLLPTSKQTLDLNLPWLLSGRMKHEEDLHGVTAFISQLGNPIRTSAGHSAFIARERSLDGECSFRAIHEAMKDASDNPSFMRELLRIDQNLLMPKESHEREKLRQSRLAVFSYVCHQMVENLPLMLEGLNGKRLKAQWMQVMTGLEADLQGMRKSPEPPVQRLPCLYNLGPKLASYQWSKYMNMVSQLQDGALIEREWRCWFDHTRIKAQLPKLQKEITITTVVNLLAIHDPVRAWKIARETGSTVSDLQPTMLETLEKEIKKIEAKLGVRWDGGEDGSHRIVCAS